MHKVKAIVLAQTYFRKSKDRSDLRALVKTAQVHFKNRVNLVDYIQY